MTYLPRSSPSAILARSAVNMGAGAVVSKSGALREGGSLRRTPDLPAVTFSHSRPSGPSFSYAVRPPLFERARPGRSQYALRKPSRRLMSKHVFDISLFNALHLGDEFVKIVRLCLCVTFFSVTVSFL